MYTKLFKSILTSTIWGEDNETRIIWITMLAMADKNGEVIATIPGLARMASVSIAATERAIEKLESPDKYSRTDDCDGRRIIKIEGGWTITNHEKYRALGSRDDQKTKNAERQKRLRDRKKSKSNGSVTQSNGSVTQSNGRVTQSNARVTQPLHIEEEEEEEHTNNNNNNRARETFAESPSLEEAKRFAEVQSIPEAFVEKWHATAELNEWSFMANGKPWSKNLLAYWKAVPPVDQRKWRDQPTGKPQTSKQPAWMELTKNANYDREL